MPNFSSAVSTWTGDAPSSTRNIACRRYCSSIRLPMKPSQTPETTAVLPMRFASSITVIKTSGAVFAPRTTSSSFITFAGLKKCMPTTSCGRMVAAAIAFTSSVDVFVARIAPGFVAPSSLRNTACLIAMSSNTASITRSASPTRS